MRAREVLEETARQYPPGVAAKELETKARSQMELLGSIPASSIEGLMRSLPLRSAERVDSLLDLVALLATAKGDEMEKELSYLLGETDA